MEFRFSVIFLVQVILTEIKIMGMCSKCKNVTQMACLLKLHTRVENKMMEHIHSCQQSPSLAFFQLQNSKESLSHSFSFPMILFCSTLPCQGHSNGQGQPLAEVHPDSLRTIPQQRGHFSKSLVCHQSFSRGYIYLLKEYNSPKRKQMHETE